MIKNRRRKDLGRAEDLAWDRIRLSVVIPVYNEVRTVETLLKKVQEVPLQLDAQALLAIIKALDSSEELPEWPEVMPVVAQALKAALSAFNEMRATEGAALEADIRARLDAIALWCARIQQDSQGTVARYRELLLERLQKAGLELDLSDERVLKELALFADRCDITEELTRLESHLAQFAQTLSRPEPVGRKLDFICQELNRETNTIGSKANNLDVTRHVIEIKNELERIREQVQNIE